MFDLKTLQLISTFNTLSDRFSLGVVPFSEADEEDDCVLLYDDSESVDTGTDFDDNSNFYRIVLDKCIDENHHDIVSYYDVPGIDFYLVHEYNKKDDSIDEYICVHFDNSDSQVIIDEDGWYFVE